MTKIPTFVAAGRLGVDVMNLVNLASNAVGSLDDVWPEIDQDLVASFEVMKRKDPVKPASTKPSTRPVVSPLSNGRKPAPEEFTCSLILDKLERSGRWGGNGVSLGTLAKHYVHISSNVDLRAMLRIMERDGLVLMGKGRDANVSLNPFNKKRVEQRVNAFRERNTISKR